MKSGNILIILVPALILLTVIIVIRLLANGGEDTWICQNGEWIKHGNPSATMPSTLCPKLENTSEKQLEPIENPAETTESTQDIKNLNYQKVAIEEIGLIMNIPNGFYFNKELAVNLSTNQPYAVNFTVQNYKDNPTETENPYQLYGIYQWDIENISLDDFKVSDFTLIESTKTVFKIDGQPAIKGIIKGERSRYSINILYNGFILKLAASGEVVLAKSITDKMVESIDFK